MEQSASAARRPALPAAEWREAVRRVPVVRLRLIFQARTDFRAAPHVFALRLHGALWHGLGEVEQYHPDPDERRRAAFARAHHGSAARPLTLDLAWEDRDLWPGQETEAVLTLLGEAVAPTWSAWVNALSAPRLQGLGQLELIEAHVLTGSQPGRVETQPAPETACSALGSLTAPEFDRPRPLGLSLLSPTFITARAASGRHTLLTTLPDLEHVIKTAHHDLARLVGAHLELGAARALRELGRACPATRADFTTIPGYRQECGLVGRALYPETPPALIELLDLARYTHLGQHVAFGCGRYRLWIGD